MNPQRIKLICSVLLLFFLCTRTEVQAENTSGPVADAFGDAQDLFNAGGPLMDIELFDLNYDQNNLYYRVDFFTPIEPGSANLPESVSGVLEFDTDQNVATGNPSLQNAFAPPFAGVDLGVDYLLDLGTEVLNPGFAQLFLADRTFVDWVPVSFDATSLQGTIPLSVLGNDDGQLDFVGIFGTFTQPTDATDRVGTSYAIPEPTMLPIGFAWLALVAIRRRRG